MHSKISKLEAFKYHGGQAMIEFAILLILMVTLIVGGTELAITAYHSNKTNDAAKAGANLWAMAIEYAKSLAVQNNDLTTGNFELALEAEREALGIDTDPDASYDEAGNFVAGETCRSVTVNTTGGDVDTCTFNVDAAGHDIADIDTVADAQDADEIRPFLPIGCTLATIPAQYSTQFNAGLPIDITACDNSKSGHALNLQTLVGQLFTAADGYRDLDVFQDFMEICTSSDTTISPDGLEKVTACRTLLDIYDTDSNADGIEDSCTAAAPCGNGIDDNDQTFRRLLVLKDLKNSDDYKQATASLSPTLVGVTKRVGLGDHNPIRIDPDTSDALDLTFRTPQCDPNGDGSIAYDNGLPQDGKIYLFNPLPIDTTNCDGTTYKVSTLVGGDATFEGLPAINRAMYSQYEKVCVTNAAGVITFVDCTANPRPVGLREWLKPPGKMCGAGTDPLTEYCPGMGNLNGATGFYFFGDSNTRPQGSFEYLPTSFASPYFRPAFQLVCGVASHKNTQYDANEDDDPLTLSLDSDLDPATGECAEKSVEGAFAVQVHTRYRSIFESFLTFGLRALPEGNENLVDYFYNPRKVGADGAVLMGAAGGEVGPLNRIGGNPTIKQFKDFRGCYQVNILPPDNLGNQIKTAVSSCN